MSFSDRVFPAFGVDQIDVNTASVFNSASAYLAFHFRFADALLFALISI